MARDLSLKLNLLDIAFQQKFFVTWYKIVANKL